MVTASGSDQTCLRQGGGGAGIEGGRCPPGLVGRQQLWRLLRQRRRPSGRRPGRCPPAAASRRGCPRPGRRSPGTRPSHRAQLPPGVAAVPPEVRRGPRADHRAVAAQLDEDALPVVAVVAVERRDVGVGGARVGQVLPVLEVGEAVASQRRGRRAPAVPDRAQAGSRQRRKSTGCSPSPRSATNRGASRAASAGRRRRRRRGAVRRARAAAIAASSSASTSRPAPAYSTVACARSPTAPTYASRCGGWVARRHGCVASAASGRDRARPDRPTRPRCPRGSPPRTTAGQARRRPAPRPRRRPAARRTAPTPQALRPSFTTSVSIPSSTCSRSENTFRNVALAPSQPVSRRWCTRSIPASSIRAQVHVALVLVHGLAEGDGAGHQAHVVAGLRQLLGQHQARPVAAPVADRDAPAGVRARQHVPGVDGAGDAGVVALRAGGQDHAVGRLGQHLVDVRRPPPSRTSAPASQASTVRTMPRAISAWPDAFSASRI